MKKIFLSLLLAVMPIMASADEGMWLVNMIESKLHEKMADKGLRLDAKTLYDEDDVSLSDAIVALAFSCTGSMISNDGLMITNHHCAYDDVHKLSTPEHNYLEDGFWALTRDKELRAPSSADGIYFLKKVIDVTDEVNKLKADTGAEGKLFGMRRVYAMMEDKYQKIYNEKGYQVSCDSFWGGQKYMIAVYCVYKDVRLVAAPPVCIASYGAEVDNWEWPQQKGDFAIYRIYTAPDGSPAEYSPENVPLHPKKTLRIATGGVRTGDYTMIMGYPGRVNRYSSSFAVEQTANVVNPIQAFYRKKQMEIIDGWMNKDPKIRLQYADYYFMLSNVQEIREGETYCYNRFGVPAIKAASQDAPLQAWIDADPARKAEYGNLIERLGKKYEDLKWIETQLNYYRETYARAFRLNKILNTTVRCCKDRAKKGLPVGSIADSTGLVDRINKWYSEYDFRVEKDIFKYALGEFYSHLDKKFQGEFFPEMYERYNGDTDAIADYIWDNSIFTDLEKINKAMNEVHDAAFYEADPLYKYATSIKILPLNKEKDRIEGKESLSSLEAKYKKALYQMRLEQGVPQYPDANSTMRITYGTVGPISPADAVTVADHTSTEGILEKYKPSEYIFTLKPEIKALYDARDWGRWGDKETGKMFVNFLSDNDITGGNSGSPVLNADGDLVGLAFDGNKEGLASDMYFDPVMNKCISVDIRFVMWILEKYMGMNYLFDELTFVDNTAAAAPERLGKNIKSSKVARSKAARK